MRVEENNVRILSCALSTKEAIEMLHQGWDMMMHMLNKITLDAVQDVDFRRARVGQGDKLRGCWH